ncbi:hypothetical protein P3T76_005054 [Phytophthora citrophthora]|uniref:Uncharacterized protein n=1 Tax=Phytophthora citrophthora TaxID=4793 RepID=A0AAD9LN99_9STRA|nr:hypothetical protein P3T76_005054 [Phytophthora citrophthora]
MMVHDVLLRLFFGDLIRLKRWNTISSRAQDYKKGGSRYGCMDQNFHSRVKLAIATFPAVTSCQCGLKATPQTTVTIVESPHSDCFSCYLAATQKKKIHFKETETEKLSTQNVMNSFHRHYQHIYMHSEDLGLEGDAVISVLQGMGFDPPKPRNLPESSDRC